MSAEGRVSKYATKNRAAEKARGYSRRKASPFFMSPSDLREARSQPHEPRAGIWLPVGATTEEVES